MWSARLDEAQAGIKTVGNNISNLRFADDTTLMAESEKELKSLLMKVKEESEKVGLKLYIQKSRTMASSPITSWQIDWETMDTVRHFILGSSKITVDGDCSYEIKRCLLLGKKKSYDQHRQHIKEQRHYFTSKGPSSQGYDFSSSHVWMWELDYKENWMLKNCCFWTMVLEKTLESPLDCKEIQPVHPKGDQSWIFIGRTDAEAETPIRGHLMWGTDWFEKTLMLGKIEGGRRGQQSMRWLDDITDSMDMILNKLQSWWWTGKPGLLHSLGSRRVGHD